jgi:ribosomal protein L37E
MIELIPAVTNAITLVSRLRTISENVKDAESRNLLADLSVELADVKIKMASMMEENANLHAKIRNFESLDTDPCPRCRKRTYTVEKSEPDRRFRAVGGLRRTYKCSSCAFSEEKLEGMPISS